MPGGDSQYQLEGVLLSWLTARRRPEAAVTNADQRTLETTFIHKYKSCNVVFQHQWDTFYV